MPASGKHNGFYETWKRYDCSELVASQGGRSELFLITAVIVPAIGELDLANDLGMIEDRGILARIEGWAGAAKLQRGGGRPYGTGRRGSLDVARLRQMGRPAA
jgi:hypothetical protein